MSDLDTFFNLIAGAMIASGVGTVAESFATSGHRDRRLEVLAGERREQEFLADQRRQQNAARVARIRAYQKKQDTDEEHKSWKSQDYPQAQYLTIVEIEKEVKAVFDEAINLIRVRRAIDKQEEEKEAPAHLGPETRSEEEKISPDSVVGIMEAYRDSILKQYREGRITNSAAFNCGRATRWFVKGIQLESSKDQQDNDAIGKRLKEYEKAMNNPSNVTSFNEKVLFFGVAFGVIMALVGSLPVAAPLVIGASTAVKAAAVKTAAVKALASYGLLGVGFGGLVAVVLEGGERRRPEVDTKEVTKAIQDAVKRRPSK